MAFQTRNCFVLSLFLPLLQPFFLLASAPFVLSSFRDPLFPWSHRSHSPPRTARTLRRPPCLIAAHRFLCFAYVLFPIAPRFACATGSLASCLHLAQCWLPHWGQPLGRTSTTSSPSSGTVQFLPVARPGRPPSGRPRWCCMVDRSSVANADGGATRTGN